MSDFNSTTFIGIHITKGDLAPLRREYPGLSHQEERFDPKSGKSIGMVWVVDQDPGIGYDVDGEEFDGAEFNEVAAALADAVGAPAFHVLYDGGYGMEWDGVVIGREISSGSLGCYAAAAVDTPTGLVVLKNAEVNLKKWVVALRKLGVKVPKSQQGIMTVLEADG